MILEITAIVIFVILLISIIINTRLYIMYNSADTTIGIIKGICGNKHIKTLRKQKVKLYTDYIVEIEEENQSSIHKVLLADNELSDGDIIEVKFIQFNDHITLINNIAVNRMFEINIMLMIILLIFIVGIVGKYILNI